VGAPVITYSEGGGGIVVEGVVLGVVGHGAPGIFDDGEVVPGIDGEVVGDEDPDGELVVGHGVVPVGLVPFGLVVLLGVVVLGFVVLFGVVFVGVCEGDVVDGVVVEGDCGVGVAVPGAGVAVCAGGVAVCGVGVAVCGEELAGGVDCAASPATLNTRMANKVILVFIGTPCDLDLDSPKSMESRVPGGHRVNPLILKTKSPRVKAARSIQLLLRRFLGPLSHRVQKWICRLWGFDLSRQ
jgi:hypothetical protein